jgi:hypothetical protein
MNPEREEVLTHRIERADRVIKYSLISMVFVVIATLLVIIVQLVNIQNSIQESLVESRRNAAENHQRTQEYVKCIAVTLLKPLAQREAADFENCANGTIDPKTGAFIPNEDNSTAQQQNSKIQVGGSPPAAAPPTEPETPPSNPPTTSAPPTPDPVETPEPTVIDRLQERLKNVLNGVESTVDNIEKGI